MYLGKRYMAKAVYLFLVVIRKVYDSNCFVFTVIKSGICSAVGTADIGYHIITVFNNPTVSVGYCKFFRYGFKSMGIDGFVKG